MTSRVLTEAETLLERERFEQAEIRGGNSPENIARRERGEYVSEYVRCRWHGWLARATLSPSEPASEPQGERGGGHKIIEGLNDAIAYAKGDTSRGREFTYHNPAPHAAAPGPAPGSYRMIEAADIPVALPPGIEPDNHHNAYACPYCNAEREKAEARVRRETLEEAAKLCSEWGDKLYKLGEERPSRLSSYFTRSGTWNEAAAVIRALMDKPEGGVG